MQSELSALILGVLEGVTEFLPVSSTGHLILATQMLGLPVPPGKVFEIVVQLGAILAVCWLYRAKLFGALFRVHKDAASRKFLLCLLLAFVPSAVVGVTLHGFIKQVLFSPMVVAAMLVLGGIVILLAERYKPQPRVKEVESFGWKLALKIGLCQAVSVIPGTSRSGATIVGALLMGVERKAAAEFSFFLAIPTMFAATFYDVYKNASLITADGATLIAVGFVAAFISAMLVVRGAIAFIGRHGFVPFAWYRIALGSLMLGLLALA